MTSAPSAAAEIGDTEVTHRIEQQLRDHQILLYMKGSPHQPRCGFSGRVIEILVEIGQRFAFVDILDNPDIRRVLPDFAQWPTFPQLWLEGELIGGCDIVEELHRKGELRSKIERAATTETAPSAQ